jgi:hypothetical protein
MDRKQVIEKISKLLSLSQSPNRHEAELAAANAAELMQKYNIEMVELDRGIVEKANIILEGRMNVYQWETILLQACAYSNFCGTMFTTQEEGVVLSIIGRDLNTKAAKMMFKYLYDAGRRLSESYGRHKHKFLEGFAIGIAKRAFSPEESWGAEEKGALVRIRDQDEKAIEEYKAEHHPDIVQVKHRKIDTKSKAVREGFAIGSDISLNRQVEEERKMIE